MNFSLQHLGLWLAIGLVGGWFGLAQEGVTPKPVEEAVPKAAEVVTNAAPAVEATAATDTPEARMGDAAMKMFQDGLLELAERECERFLKEFPESPRTPEIVLVQAQARIRLKQYDAALGLLAERTATAGKLADEFAFWPAVARFEKGELAAAADAFAGMAAGFPESGRRLEALYNEAFARSRLGDGARALDLLRAPEGPFQAAVKARPGDPWVVRGLLLAAELLLQAREAEGAAATLAQLAGATLEPAFDWQRRLLSARVDFLAARVNEALGQITNLWTAVTNSVRADLVADAVLLQGEIEERLDRLDAARLTYERNLSATVPEAFRRHALQKTVELGIRQNRLADTVARLEEFAAQHPQDELIAATRLAAGELRLRQYYAATAPGGTGAAAAAAAQLLQRAGADFGSVITNFPNSEPAIKAWLGKGWALWEEGTNRLAEGATAFQTAAERLPRSADQAIARFKLGDCQYLRREFPAAISNYWFAATNYLDVGGLPEAFGSQALYQAVRSGLEVQDLGASTAAMFRLLQTDPTGDLAARSGLLTGRALDRRGQPQAARALYESFIQRFPGSTVLPEVGLAMAHTYEQEQAWPAAINTYSNWVATYRGQTNLEPELLAQANFDLARLSYQVRPDTNAVAQLKDFVRQFPDNPNAPLAQYLAGEYFYNQGDFATAELMFQDKAIAQNPASLTDGLTYRSRLMAGRAAVALRSYRSARDHFDWVITNGPLLVAESRVPVSLAAEAYIFRGDTFLLESDQGSTNLLERFGEAIVAFSKVAEHFPTNEFAPLALGRIGDCHLQLASVDPKRYALATDAYRRVIESGAGAAARSMAEVALGAVFERQAAVAAVADQGKWLDQALDQYLRVFYATNLRQGEQPDPYWVKRAGLAAVDLAQAQKRWDLARSLYGRLMVDLPALRARMERRIAELPRTGAGAGK